MKRNRNTIRLKGYDYSREGYYSITVCTKDRKILFGNIQKNCRGTIFCALNKNGEIIKKCWEAGVNT